MISKVIFSAAIFVLTLLLPTQALAIATSFGNIDTNPTGLANSIIRIAMGVAGGVAFLLIIFGGFRLAFSQGDPKAIQEGRDIITSAIVGLIIIVLSTFLLRLIGIDILGLPI